MKFTKILVDAANAIGNIKVKMMHRIMVAVVSKLLRDMVAHGRHTT
jgi:hypothetical protein